MTQARKVFLAGFVSILALFNVTSIALAGHTGGQPENYQTDLSTGRFTSGIPVPVPPGRRGIQPSIGIAYASGSSAALCGTGWTLEVGATEKSTKFGVVTNTENQNSYVFNVAGVTSELVAINAEKTEFRAETESSFMKFKYTPSVMWEAWDRAGTYYRFDQAVSDPNGRVYAHYLSRVEDLFGNTMTFTYWTDPNGWQKYLTQIDYTGNTSGLAPTQKVVLTWESRPDVIYSLKEGLSNSPATFKITQRLQKIETFSNNQLVRKIQLTYGVSGSTGRSLLTQVRVYGSDGTTSLPATTYTYSVPSGNYQTSSSSTWLSGHGNSNTQTLMGDLDRDGKTDLLTYDKPNGYWHYAKSNGTGFTNLTNFRTEKPNCTAFTGDFNGDGWIDLAVYDSSGNVDVALGTAAYTWGAFTRWLTGFGNNTSYSPIAADYNGDGKTDFATFEANNGYVHMGTSTGTGFNWPAHCLTFGPQKYPLVGDFNGDGLTDVGTTDTSGNVDICLGTGTNFFNAVRWLTGFSSWESYTPIPFDANGDGLTDYATFGKSWGYWHWGTSKGSEFNWPGHYLTDYGTNQTPLIGDFNGDGMPDIGYFNPSSGSWNICLRLGDKPDLMTLLENGLGGSVNLVYGTSTSFDNTQSGTSMLGLAVPVLTSMTLNDGRGNSYTTTYSYSGGVFDYSTREFRGFAYAKSTDPDGNYSETYFHQDQHKKGRPYKEAVYALPQGGGGPSETIDQSQTTFSGTQWGVGHDGGDNKRMAQSFVLSGTGAKRIQKLELYFSGTTGSPSGGVTVKVQTNNPTYTQPSGTLVDPNASVLLNPPQIGAWNTVNLPVPLDLTAGTKYWIVIEYAGTIINSNTYQVGSNYGSYSAGEMKGAYPGTTVWNDWGGGYDLMFKVWVTQQATQNPPTLLQQIDRVWSCSETYPGSHFQFLASQTTSLYDGQEVPKQTKVEYTYDSYGNVTQVKELGDLAVTGDERTTITEYVMNTTNWILGVPNHTQVKDANNAIVRESWAYYDNNANNTATPVKGSLTKEEVWLSTSGTKPTSTHVYDSYGDKTSTTDALNRTTTTTYDTQKIFPVTVTNHLGHTLQTTYDTGTGNILTTTDPNGQVTTNTYDVFGRIVSVIGPQDTSALPGVLYSYDLTVVPNKKIKQVRTTPQGSELYTSYEFYDGMDRVIQVKTPAEDPTQQVVSETKVFDTRGLVKEAYKPHLVSTSTGYSAPDMSQPKTVFTYDALGRVTKQTSPDASYSTTAYNQWMVTITDELGKQKLRYVDAYGRLIKVEEKNSGSTYVTTYLYDTLGNLLRTTDHNGNQINIAYDSLGRKTQMSDPDMGTWNYTYDFVGNLLTQVDAKGQQLSFTYDALNRLTQKVVPGSGTVPGSTVVYLYDDPTKQNYIGRLSKITDNSGATDFYYDILGREIKTIKVVDSVSYTFERTYDALNRITSIKYPDLEVVNYTYNPQGIETVASSSTTYVSNLDYTATGQISKQVANGNLMTTNYTYDPNTLRLASLTTTNGANITLQQLNYAFDYAGNVTSITDVRRNQTQSFTYDDLHRLTQAQSPGTYGTRSYGYDPIGNLTLKDGVTQTYADALHKHAVSSRSDGLSMTYDSNGNMITKGTQSLVYDAENRLTQVTSGGNTQATFTYDGDGGRVKKVTSGGTTTYLGKLYEKKPDGSFIKYVWVGSTRLASKTSTGTTLFYHTNHLGSTDIITDAAGTEVSHYEYTPWGEIFSSSGTVSVPHRYTGKELDSETGFYFYEARYYDPQLGRFITPDTFVPKFSDPQDFNRYTYANNNPIIYTDPTGHFSWKKFWKSAVGAFVGVVAAVVLGPAGLALVGSTMAGIIGGAIGGAISGGLNGGWKGALIGGALGGVFGGIGGWAMAGQHYGVLAGMFAGGVGVTAATNSWDSFAGGLAGGLTGALTGFGITHTFSQQFANYRAGNGFASNNQVLVKALKDANLQNVVDATRNSGQRDIGTLIQKIANSQWAAEGRGNQVVESLAITYQKGQLNFGNLDSGLGGITTKSGVTINSRLSDSSAMVTLVHEGTHLVQTADGWPQFAPLSFERQAFDTALGFARATHTPGAQNVSNGWLRNVYSNDVDDLN